MNFKFLKISLIVIHVLEKWPMLTWDIFIHENFTYLYTLTYIFLFGNCYLLTWLQTVQSMKIYNRVGETFEMDDPNYWSWKSRNRNYTS